LQKGECLNWIKIKGDFRTPKKKPMGSRRGRTEEEKRAGGLQGGRGAWW